jgi:hypothetical protein
VSIPINNAHGKGTIAIQSCLERYNGTTEACTSFPSGTILDRLDLFLNSKKAIDLVNSIYLNIKSRRGL